MTPATWPRESPLGERLLVVDPSSGALADARLRDLGRFLSRGDLVVVNDAATLPASLSGVTATGARIEVRLAAKDEGSAWWAVLLGEGDWHTRTEDRPAPPPLAAGTVITIESDLRARVRAVSPISPRLVSLSFEREGAELWSAIYRWGRPVQYAHVARPLRLWHTQNAYAARPWAVEQPSAGRPLVWELLVDLKRRGVEIATVTHAAGLSSTGDADIDARLPLPERYDIPARTVAAVREARARDGRILAVGTTVVRALEGCARSRGELTAGEGVTDLVIVPGFRPQVASGLLTGLHDPSASHFALLKAFSHETLLKRAYAHAAREHYLDHEFGDSNLILPGALAKKAA